jgi:hypothetical protein
MHHCTVTRPFTAFSLFSCNYSDIDWANQCDLPLYPINKKALHPYHQDEELLLSCYHLHSLLPHDNNLKEYLCTLTRLRGLPASSSFVPGDFFSQLQGLFRGVGTQASHQLLALWSHQTSLLALSKLFTLCYYISASFQVITCSFSKVKDLSDQYYRARKEKALLTLFRYMVWLKVTH